MDTHAIVERVARESYGRLLAFLVSRSRDMAAAEDALSEAFQAALEHWPRKGIPDKPEAWLLVAGRRRLIDEARAACVRSDAVPTLLAAAHEAQARISPGIRFPDERLKLLFVCAHPAIDPAARSPLMLQTVLGLDAARIASAFLVKPTTMGQRLSRAKAKIRDAGIRFELPETKELPSRLDAVLEAIYVAYGSGWDDVAGADPRRRGLAKEALELGRLLLQLMPGEPEVLGLTALMLHCEARRAARRGPKGAYVPLSEQDTSLWSREMIEEAESYLAAASRSAQMGRFQLEAAIQSLHAQRLQMGCADWEGVALLYEGLVRLAPTTGALVGRAAAVAEARGAEIAWGLIESISLNSVRGYQPYWALAAHLLKRLERFEEATAAYRHAIGLCEDQAVRDFLVQQARGCPNWDLNA